jgi:protein-disulfide isomerase
MLVLRIVGSVFLLWICTCPVGAQTTVLNYSARLSADGSPFNGIGSFAFAIQETNGVIWWTSGELPFEGTTNLPPRVIKLAVNDGLYSVRLGDVALGMKPLDISTLRRAALPRLRVWFNDGVHGWQRTGEDVPLADALAAAPDPKAAPMTGAQADALLREFREFRVLYEREHPRAPVGTPAPPAPTATVSITGSPTLGRADAPLVLVEFIDFECPFCKQAHKDALGEVKRKYVETGKLRLVMRNLALPFHPHAEPAARAALCAQRQQQFWPMHDQLLALSPNLATANLLKAAEDLKLDLPAFRACLEANNFADQIKREGKDAGKVGINGTPTFVLGKANGDQVTGEVLVGATSFAFFDQEIQKRLALH